MIASWECPHQACVKLECSGQRQSTLGLLCLWQSVWCMPWCASPLAQAALPLPRASAPPCLQIPGDCTSGILGRFRPSIPLSRHVSMCDCGRQC